MTRPLQLLLEQFQALRMIWMMVMIVMMVGKEVEAFDTGHHEDLMANILMQFNFSQKIIEATQVLNWVNDFYSIGSVAIIEDFQYLHCDALRNTSESVCYMKTIAQNMKRGVEQMTTQNDYFGMISLLSFSLHAIQDFYTHSTWPETHTRAGTCDCYRTDTLWAYMDNISGLPDIFSDKCEGCPVLESRFVPDMIPHGVYCDGLNKDSIVRPNHEEAYIYAYIASLEWLFACYSWSSAIDGGSFWNRMRVAEVDNPDRDWDTARKISLWVTDGRGAYGHWKGSGSGWALKSLMKDLWWTLTPDSQLIKSMKESKTYQILLTPNPYDECDPSSSYFNATVPPISSYNITNGMKAVYVRTVEIFKTEEFDLTANLSRNFTNADASAFSLYARITIANQTYIEPTQKGILRPYWTSIRVFQPYELVGDDPTVTIDYFLYQENSWNDDSVEDIHALQKGSTIPSGLRMIYHINSHEIEGDVQGVYDSYDNVYLAQGELSYVKFYITTVDLSSCGTDLYWGKLDANTPPQCPNTAFAQNGLPRICSVSGRAAADKEFRNSILAVVFPVGYFFLGGLLAAVFWCISKRRKSNRTSEHDMASATLGLRRRLSFVAPPELDTPEQGRRETSPLLIAN
eukprot:TRINITY_DN22845_c0_g1_i1.p1 TRINITY_DN22845_c0_g1~~TRINITY_DN22845_c0_g1_i1.p1  ORF type:complete len:629 (+),score=144.17 TRINITY_DN22845_c0_g1_i1:68-1954(+)